MTMTPPGTVGPGYNASLAAGVAPFAGALAVPPYTALPALCASLAMTAGQAWWGRSLGSGVISRIGVFVLTQSGNISVGVYSSGGGISPPGVLLQTSGSVPCPAAGSAVVNLGGSVMVDQSCYLAISADTAPSIFGAGTGVASTTGMGQGFAYLASPEHPLPPIAPGLSPGPIQTMRGMVPILWGLP